MARKTFTEMEHKFIDNMVMGKSRDASARLAGYADWKHEGDRLMMSPKVRDEVVARLQARSVSWEMLKLKAMRITEANMKEGHDDGCPKTDQMLPIEERVCLCGYDKLYPRDKQAAANKVFDVLGKSNPDSLTKTARKEDDDAVSRREMVEDTLGDPTLEVPPPAPVENDTEDTVVH